MLIRNRQDLIDHGLHDLRDLALNVLECGLRASNPFDAARASIRLRGDILETPSGDLDLRAFRKIVVLGAGKASLQIARALDELLDARITTGLVVVPESQNVPLRRIRVVSADHPFPTIRSAAAGAAVLRIASQLGPDDLLVSCMTGGSSALLSAPPVGVTVQEKAALHKLLLSCGAPIKEMNAVRKHVSKVKGGRTAAAARGAHVLNLTVSDVAGDALDLITDPTVPDTSTPADAIEVLKRWSLWDEVAPSIRDFLRAPASTAPDLNGQPISNLVLTSGDHVCAAMRAEAKRRGLHAVSLGTLEADGAQLGSILAEMGRASIRSGEPFGSPGVAIACGGESTVALADHGNGSYGAGGPNQELVLSGALRLQPEDRVVIAAVDSDGSDGGTDFAGGIADGLTHHRARQNDVDLHAALQHHRSSQSLVALHDAIETGTTGTNVNDLLVMVVTGTPRGDKAQAL